jgi:hypothetical protein
MAHNYALDPEDTYYYTLGDDKLNRATLPGIPETENIPNLAREEPIPKATLSDQQIKGDPLITETPVSNVPKESNMTLDQEMLKSTQDFANKLTHGQVKRQLAEDLHQDQLIAIENDFRKASEMILSESQKIANEMRTERVDEKQFLHGLDFGLAIKLILGGIGSALAGGDNPAEQFLASERERYIKAQTINMNQKNNLMTFYTKMFGEVKDAQNMLRMIANDEIADQFRNAELNSRDEKEILNAKMNYLKYKQENMAIADELARKQVLLSQLKGEPGQEVNKIDPTMFVPDLVPKEHQKEVFAEIKRAQDTRQMSNSIIKAFDKAAKENTVLRTGAGLLRTPPGVLALHQAMQPTFKDLEGTVRQAAMDNTFVNITPMPGDMKSKIDSKRNSLVEYLKSKSSAPIAKAYGIDLDKFQSTRPSDAAPRSMTNEQMKLLKWAKLPHSDPGDRAKAQKVLEKLGVAPQ